MNTKISFSKLAVIIVIILFVVFLFYLKFRERILPELKIKLAGQELTVEVAKTPLTWKRGLSDRKELAANRGLLFIFSNEARQSFWMKDMRFPIDIIWFDNGIVVDIAPNVKPSFIEPLPEYMPRLPANSVLEVNAGWSEKFGLKIGDQLELLTK